MNILDFLILVAIGAGAYRGFKYGCFRSFVSLVGSILIYILAYYLKSPLGVILYENLPFKSFGGIFKGISSFNILVYEGLAFFLCIIVLFAILKFIVKLTGIIDKLVNLTLVLALPNKILGLIFGTLEHYIYVFLVLFVLAQIPFTSPMFNESKLGQLVIGSTPILSKISTRLYNSVTEVYKVCTKYSTNIADQEIGDYKTLDILLNYKIISPDSVKKLKDKGKITVKNIEQLLERYEENND